MSSRDIINVQPWIRQLYDASIVLELVKPEHRERSPVKNFGRDIETLKKAYETIAGAQDQLNNTINLLWETSEAFKVHYWTPDHTGRSFTYCDQSFDKHGLIREGKLRELVIQKKSTSDSTVDTRVYCAHEPRGMGKTVAMECLASDVQVKQKFPHGIHWFSFGTGVQDRTLMEQVQICALNCGQNHLANKLMNEVSVKVAIRKLGDIFMEKTILMLIDDVWGERKEELRWFKRSLDNGSKCVIVYTCREYGTVNTCDDAVTFDFLDPCGDISRGVLLSCLDDYNRHDVMEWIERSPECRKSLEEGLERCCGWMLCLSIAGSLLRDEIGDCNDMNEVKESLYDWAQSLFGGADCTGDSTADRLLGPIVDQGLEQAKQNLRKRNYPKKLSSTICANFEWVCVMQKKKAMPVTVLMRIWMLNERDTLRVVKELRRISLLKLNHVKGVGDMIRVHDKIIDLYTERVGENIYRKHEELLETFLESSNRVNGHEEVCYRPWWELSAEHEYVMQHLGYHLGKAKLEKELLGLLRDARFMMRWLEDERGLAGVAENFDTVVRARLGENEGLEELGTALVSSWPSLRSFGHTLGFEMFLRLEKGKAMDSKEDVNRFLESIELYESCLWLQPVKPHCLQSDPREKCCYELKYGFPIGISQDCSKVLLSNPRAFIVYDLKTRDVVQYQDLPKCFFLPLGVRRVLEDDDYAYSIDGNYAMVVYDTRKECVKAVLMDLMKDTRTTIVLQEAVTAACYEDRREIDSCAVHSRDLFALGLRNGNVVLVFVLSGGNLQCTLLPSAHASSVACVAFSADGTRVVSGSSNGTVKVWSTSQEAQLWSFCGHESRVCSVAFSPDGMHVVSGSYDRTVRVWSMSSGEQLRSFSIEGIAICVAFSADGTRVVSGSTDGMVRAWSVTNGDQLCSLSEHKYDVYCVAFSEDGACIVSESRDRSVRVWSVSEGEQLCLLSGHETTARCVAFSTDRSRVVSACDDKTVRVWTVEGDACEMLEKWIVSDVAQEVRFVSGNDAVEALVSGIWTCLPRNIPGDRSIAKISPWQVTMDKVCVRRKSGDRYMSVAATFRDAVCYASHWDSKSTAHGQANGRVIICRLREID